MYLSISSQSYPILFLILGQSHPKNTPIIFFNFVVRKFTEIIIDLEKLWAWLLRTLDFIIE